MLGVCRNRWVAVGASLAIVGGLAACGGDDGGSVLGGSGDFCDLARDADDTSTELSGLFDGGLPDAKALEDLFDDFLKQAEAAQKQAPSSIKDDLADSIDAFKDFRKILDKYDYDISKAVTDSEFQALAPRLESTGDAVEQALLTECGIQPDSDEGDSSGGTIPGGLDTIPGFSVPDVSFDATGDPVDIQVQVLRQIFPKLDEDGARCLVEKGQEVSENPDLNTYLQLLGECGLSPEDFVGS